MGAFANIGTSPHISCKSIQIIVYHLMIFVIILYNNRILVANIWNFSTYIFEMAGNNRILFNDITILQCLL